MVRATTGWTTLCCSRWAGTSARARTSSSSSPARKGENHFLEGYRHDYTHLLPLSHKGPLTLLDGEADAEDLELAARIIARFSQGRDAECVSVEITQRGASPYTIEVRPLTQSQIPQDWYV